MEERERELKELEEIPPIPRPTLYDMIRDCGGSRESKPRNRALMASFAMMANRCSEGLNVTTEDVHKEVAIDVLSEELEEMMGRLNRLRTEVDVGSTLDRDVSEAKDELGKLFDEFNIVSELKNRFQDMSLGFDVVDVADEIATRYPQTLVYVVKLITLKRKKRVPRNIPVLVVDPLGSLFVDAVNRDLKKTFFGITRQRVWQLFQREGIFAFYKDDGYPVPKNPLRHMRLSEVSNVLNRVQLDRYAGWKIKGTADKYIHMKWDDFVIPLLRVARRAPPLGLNEFV